MGRIRASLARTAADQELQDHLSKAGRELERALDVCTRVSRDRSPEAGPSRRRAQGITAQLRGALATVNSVGHLAQPMDEDIDRLSEETLSERYRAQRAARIAEKVEAAAKLKAEQEVVDGEEE